MTEYRIGPLRQLSRIEFHRRVGKHFSPWALFGWFAGLAIPFALLMSFFIGWHNEAARK
jgi:hypothetical protein